MENVFLPYGVLKYLNKDKKKEEFINNIPADNNSCVCRNKPKELLYLFFNLVIFILALIMLIYRLRKNKELLELLGKLTSNFKKLSDDDFKIYNNLIKSGIKEDGGLKIFGGVLAVLCCSPFYLLYALILSFGLKKY
jgi:hypothetical protein